MIAEARDNLAFGTVDEWAGLATPDGVDVTAQPLWDDDLARFATDAKIELAKELERLTLAADQRIRVDDSNYADSWSEVAVATTTGIRRSGRANGCYVRCRQLADDGDETQTGFGFSVGRNPQELDLVKASADGGRAGDAAPRCHQAGRASGSRSCSTRSSPPSSSASSRSTLNGESVVKGRSLFRDRLGETVAAPAVTLDRRPDQPATPTRRPSRRGGSRRPSQRADRRRRPPALRPQQLLGPPGRHRVDRQCRARRVRRDAPASGASPCRSAPGHADPGGDHRRHRRRSARAERLGHALRRQPDQRRLLHRGVGDARSRTARWALRFAS